MPERKKNIFEKEFAPENQTEIMKKRDKFNESLSQMNRMRKISTPSLIQKKNENTRRKEGKKTVPL